MDSQNRKSIPQPDANMPIGFAMALSQDISAMQHFALMNETEQRNLLTRARAVKSKAEMQDIVDGLTDRQMS